MTSGKVRRRAVLLLVALAVGGCDKCGHRINLNAPGIQHACGDESAAPR